MANEIETREETEEERTARLKQFVLDVFDGVIFTSAGLTVEETLRSFPLLAMLAPDQLPADTAVVWERMVKACLMSINDKPCFVSCHTMSAADWERVRKALDKMYEAEKRQREVLDV